MRKLLLFTIPLLLAGCKISGGMGAIDWKSPGTPDSYTCETAGENAQAYYETGEHPNLENCP
jgi:hypothetical protein|tara:strand:- start:3941 stop:4126 length:186 start_codon:yes stop_codon:yes gene_type:complete